MKTINPFSFFHSLHVGQLVHINGPYMPDIPPTLDHRKKKEVNTTVGFITPFHLFHFRMYQISASFPLDLYRAFAAAAAAAAAADFLP